MIYNKLQWNWNRHAQLLQDNFHNKAFYLQYFFSSFIIFSHIATNECITSIIIKLDIKMKIKICQEMHLKMWCTKWNSFSLGLNVLTYWGRVTHICVNKLTIIGSDNGLSPGRRQAIVWTNAGILLIGPWGTNFSEILIEIQSFSLKKIRLKMSSAKCCSFRLGLNVLKQCLTTVLWTDTICRV